tara:strand:- start:273 stop:593 length:321 start_codon:yes stop_codon:yes gene_type:complete
MEYNIKGICLGSSSKSFTDENGVKTDYYQAAVLRTDNNKLIQVKCTDKPRPNAIMVINHYDKGDMMRNGEPADYAYYAMIVEDLPIEVIDGLAERTTKVNNVRLDF